MKVTAIVRLYIFACAILCVSTVGASANRRVALVIGNAAYEYTVQLGNPVNDAVAVASALKKDGFEVILAKNLTKRGMEKTVVRFARLAQDADAALFYYAGHGLQYQGVNYLVPTDARLEDEFSINFELTRAADVISALEGAHGIKILVLDACRNNPLAVHLMQQASTRSLGAWRGLARIDAIHGMVIAYSAQPNQVAMDGGGRNSPFAQALLRYIDQPGLEIGAMFRRVTKDVNQATDGKQTPELSLSLLGDFYLNPRPSDMQAWTKIRDTNDTAKFRKFLNDYPSSILVHDARERIAAIERAHDEQERQAQESAAREKAQHERDQMIRAIADRERRERDKLSKELAEITKARDDQTQQLREQLARAKAERQELAKALAQLHEIKARPPVVQPQIDQAGKIQKSIEQERLDRQRLAQQLAALTKAREAQEQNLREQTKLAQAERDKLAKSLARRGTEQPGDATKQADAMRATIEQEKHEREHLAKQLADLATARTEQEKQLRDEIEQARTERNKLASVLTGQKAARGAAPVSTADAGRTQGEKAPPRQVALLTKPEQQQPSSVIPPPPLSGDLARDLQKELRRVGCYSGVIDGDWGKNSKTALLEFQNHAGTKLASLEPSRPALMAVTERERRVCPLVCGKGYKIKDDRCVEVACKRDYVRNRSGKCERRGKPQLTAHGLDSKPTSRHDVKVVCGGKRGCRKIRDPSCRLTGNWHNPVEGGQNCY